MSSNILKTQAVKAFAVWLAAAGGGLEVINGGAPFQAIVIYRSTGEFTENGIEEPQQGTAKALTTEAGTLEYGRPITVNGQRVFVTEVEPDVAGAITRFDFQEARPVNEALL